MSWKIGKVAQGAWAASLVLVLGGCNSLFGDKIAIRPAQNMAAPELNSEYAATQLEAARQALREDRLSDAIAGFRNARVDAGQAAAAANGLAVAYARLGRPDLAERYFNQAIMLAPEDTRYAANLQRFHRANAAEQAIRTASSSEPASPVEAVRTALPDSQRQAAVVVSRPASRLVRVSGGEVQLAQARAMAPRPAVVALARPDRASYPVRIGLSSREVFVGRKPAAAQLSAAKVAARQEYPVKISIKSR